jgi:hypothetical protein
MLLNFIRVNFLGILHGFDGNALDRVFEVIFQGWKSIDLQLCNTRILNITRRYVGMFGVGDRQRFSNGNPYP